jgi:hypothetical protein
MVRPESFKKVLRYYHNQANGEPNAFAAPSLSHALFE